MLEPYTKQVLDDVETIVDIEFMSRGFVRKRDTMTVVGLCTDGIVAGVVTVDLSGTPSSIVTLQIPESTMQGLAESDLLPYFHRNKQHAHQSMGEYCRLVAHGLRESGHQVN